MLIVPLEKSIDWSRPPLVTLLLVVVNCLILFAFQGSDDAALEEAVEYYLESDLPAIEARRAAGVARGPGHGRGPRGHDPVRPPGRR
jgi:hypothetical protein